jgi:hypothetical protein
MALAKDFLFKRGSLSTSFLLSCAQVANIVPDLPPSDLAGTAMARKVSAFKNRKCFFLKIKDLLFFLLLAQQFTQVQGTPLTR